MKHRIRNLYFSALVLSTVLIVDMLVALNDNLGDHGW